MFVPVTGTAFVRDTGSMGLSNTNTAEKNEYYAKLQLIKTQKENLNKVSEEMQELRGELSEIKELLARIINKQ